jgi:very-short-patch-repair endonuclease
MGIIMKVIEKNMFLGAKVELFTLALQMRKNPTEAERVMWKILRKFRQSGFPFRRQHPIEFYVADFYCHKLRLVIEVDGEIHTEKDIQSHDEGRTSELERFAIKVLRFTNSQVLNDSDLVVEKINATIKEINKTS